MIPARQRSPTCGLLAMEGILENHISPAADLVTLTGIPPPPQRSPRRAPSQGPHFIREGWARKQVEQSDRFPASSPEDAVHGHGSGLDHRAGSASGTPPRSRPCRSGRRVARSLPAARRCRRAGTRSCGAAPAASTPSALIPSAFLSAWRKAPPNVGGSRAACPTADEKTSPCSSQLSPAASRCQPWSLPLRQSVHGSGRQRERAARLPRLRVPTRPDRPPHRDVRRLRRARVRLALQEHVIPRERPQFLRTRHRPAARRRCTRASRSPRPP